MTILILLTAYCFDLFRCLKLLCELHAQAVVRARSFCRSSGVKWAFTPRPTTYDGKFFFPPETGQATGHFCLLENRPLMRHSPGKRAREHLSYFERFIRHTANNLCREAESSRSNLKVPRMYFFYLVLPRNEDNQCHPRDSKTEGRKHCSFQRIHKEAHTRPLSY